MEDTEHSPDERAEALKQQVSSSSLPTCFSALFFFQGLKEYAEGRYEKSLDLFSQAIALAPSNGVFYGNRSAALFQLQRWRECSSDCKLASDNGKRSDIKIQIRGHKAIMKVASNDDDLQMALSFLQSALVCDPRNAEAKADLDAIKRVQKTRAEAHLSLEKQPATCLREVESALRLVPQHFKLQVLRLQCLSKADKHQQVRAKDVGSATYECANQLDTTFTSGKLVLSFRALTHSLL